MRHCAVDEERGAARKAHAFDFVCALDHAATGGDGRGGDQVEVGVGGADPFREDEGHVFVESDCGGAPRPRSPESATEESVRTFVFLPGEDVAVACERTGSEKLVRPALFECGTDEQWLRPRGNDERPEAFTAVETQIGEVDGGTCRVGEDDGIDPFAGSLTGERARCGSQSFGVGKGLRLAR